MVMSAFSELQRRVVCDRMSQGRRRNAPPPLGLRRRSDRTIEVDPCTWPIITRLFELAADAPSLRSLHATLAADGIRLPYNKMVRAISNPAYASGSFELADGSTVNVELEHPISPELLAWVRRWLEDRRSSRDTARVNSRFQPCGEPWHRPGETSG
jgi:hypothetical protein